MSIVRGQLPIFKLELLIWRQPAPRRLPLRSSQSGPSLGRREAANRLPGRLAHRLADRLNAAATAATIMMIITLALDWPAGRPTEQSTSGRRECVSAGRKPRPLLQSRLATLAADGSDNNNNNNNNKSNRCSHIGDLFLGQLPGTGVVADNQIVAKVESTRGLGSPRGHRSLERLNGPVYHLLLLLLARVLSEALVELLLLLLVVLLLLLRLVVCLLLARLVVDLGLDGGHALGTGRRKPGRHLLLLMGRIGRLRGPPEQRLRLG